ncbi:hypothetical protein VKT23_010248 [Stygiomarasmius scandens]|uniref:tyrosinase n=1 Tax=Marasmiellus scandens TaxID=2682957 RepID=A0ABR1JF41_9AGAR
MGNVPIAAFDPIFWLHHANIDRLLAIWQTLYPNKWWQSDTIHDKDGKPVGTFKPTDPLEPFHRDTIATTHDSNGVRYHTELGYTYPELQRWNYPSEEEFIESVKKAVHDLYAPDSELCLITAYHDFLVNVEFERFALEGAPFTVKTLLNGETIGSIYNFSAATYGGCVNCAVQQKVNVLTTGQVSLTSAHRELVQDEKITELTDYGIENVSNYLKQNLEWKSSRWRGCALWDGFAQEAQANSY